MKSLHRSLRYHASFNIFFLYKLCCNERMIVDINFLVYIALFHVFYATLYIYGYVKPKVRIIPFMRYLHYMRFLLQVTQNAFYATGFSD